MHGRFMDRGVRVAVFPDFDEMKRIELEHYAKELLAGKELIIPFSGCQDVMQYAFSI